MGWMWDNAYCLGDHVRKAQNEASVAALGGLELCASAGKKGMKDGSVRIKCVGGPCHGGEIRVYLDDEWHNEGKVTLPYGDGRVEIYRLHPPMNKRSAKWILVHDVAGSEEASK